MKSIKSPNITLEVTGIYFALDKLWEYVPVIVCEMNK